MRGVMLAESDARFNEILTRDALDFVFQLQEKFGPTRDELLEARKRRRAKIAAGELPDFLPETASIRNADWKVAPVPVDLQDRRVEITGPVDRKMIINALNSGAKVFMADFEDATTPTWSNLMEGQLNLRDAVRRSITYSDPKTEKQYALNDSIATLLVRPRGWHMPEAHVEFDGTPISASLFDFGLFIWHNAREQLARGTGPYFYLPKIESHLEARLWNDVFVYAEETLALSPGTIKATVLIETILASFEMDEILYELRDHSAGLNCGRWDYIFSYIKVFAESPSALLPDRARVTMTTPFMRNYSKLLIRTCHRRGIHAMGGMAAFIPIKNDPEANERAIDQVKADKEREVTNGHDGTWVAHPGLVPVAQAIFDAHMPGANQINRPLEELNTIAKDLIEVSPGEITEAGLRQNVVVALGYLESWLRGVGCVPLFNLMEDAATAEISRAQLWQWVHHKSHLVDGRMITLDLCFDFLEKELQRQQQVLSDVQYEKSKYRQAAQLLRELVSAPKFVEFLTLPAYDRVLAEEGPVAFHQD
jgi:malate synthase